MQLDWLTSDASTLSQADSPARTPALPARAPDSPENAPVCGVSLHDSSPSLDRLGYSLRMFLASELAALTGCYPTWKRSATPHGRSWWVLATSERPTDAIESGSWPAATAGDANASGSRNLPGSQAHQGTSLTDALVRSWATPAAQDHKNDSLPPSQARRNTLPGNVIAGLPPPGPVQHEWEPPRVLPRAESRVGRDADGIPAGLLPRDRRAQLKALGNSVVPQVVEAIGRAILRVEV